MEKSAADPSNLSIHLKDIQFGYTPGQINLEIPEFTLKAQETLFLYGPSGCGKSTLLNICAGILLPQEGQVQVVGKELTQISSHKRDLHRGMNIGVIFQQFNLIEYLNVLDNVILPARLHHKKNFSETRQRALELLKELELLEYKDSMVSTLSIGQRQRVAAVRSFLLAPPLIIADEPTSSLDQKNTERFMQSLLKLAQENATSILFVSHDERLAKYFNRSLSLEELNIASSGGQK